jgi:hypothetical protein
MRGFARFGLATRQNTGFARRKRGARWITHRRRSRIRPSNVGAARHDRAARRERRSEDSSSLNRAPQEHS